MAERPIREGDRVRYRDAVGVWRETTAASGVEPTHDVNPRTGRLRKKHDFPVVYLHARDPRHGVMGWPAEDVELVDDIDRVEE